MKHGLPSTLRRPAIFTLAAAPILLASSPPPTQKPELNLSVWRKPDTLGRACVSCHSPDGIELAAYNFSDDTIRRRAAPHLGPADANALVQLIHQVRAKYGFTHLLDPFEDRPLQPGRSVLPGETPETRDLAFAQEILPLLPKLTQGRISSMPDASQAKDQLLAVNLASLTIGIPFNRISEDGFHGKEHATLADWIPDLPTKPDFAAQDRYLRQPTEANLAPLEPKDLGPRATVLQNLVRLKQEALLQLQHRLRTSQTTTFPAPLAWKIGELARFERHADANLLHGANDLKAKKTQGPELNLQMKDLRLGWFWLGWMGDPSLQHIDRSRPTQRGDYFTNFLWQDGPYALHNAFMISRKIVQQAFVPGAWGSPSTPQHFVLHYALFLNNGFAQRYEPKGEAHRALYRTFTCNSFRMSLRLLIQDLAQTGRIDHKPPTLQQIQSIAACLDAFDPQNREPDHALVQAVQKAVEAAKLYGDP